MTSFTYLDDIVSLSLLGCCSNTSLPNKIIHFIRTISVFSMVNKISVYFIVNIK